MTICRSCEENTAPTHRGVYLCVTCTELLLRQLEQPFSGQGKVVRASGYGDACKVCGEYAGRKMVQHPEWGRICEVDIREAAEIHGGA